MDKIQNAGSIPANVKEAYNLLLQYRIVTITEPIHETDDTGWTFECAVKCPYPNEEGLPHEVPLQILIPQSFPRKPVEVTPLDEHVSGFPHQDAESRKLCLPEEARAPRDESRLVCYVKWAIEWLRDAANGTLLKPGAPYELPDFSRKLLIEPLPSEFPLIFDESPDGYEIWREHINKSGHLECVCGAAIPAISSIRFSDAYGSLIRESTDNCAAQSEAYRLDGRWIMLPDIRYHRHRPPQTYEELECLCSTVGLNFYRILKEAWMAENACGFGLILIGFPIPKSVGESPIEIHWQPLIFKTCRQNLQESKTAGGKQNLRNKSRSRYKAWSQLTERGSFAHDQQLPWGKAENINRARLYKRGAYSSRIQSKYIALFGCGALGSSVAELLARGGVNQLSLFDFDTLEFGNLCRHTLDGSAVGSNKATALAERLARACPVSRIKGHHVRVPFNSRTDETARMAIAQADILIDCTVSESAFEWLDEYARQSHKRFISLFFNFHAELLTICISGKNTSCAEVFTNSNRCIEREDTPVDPKVYFREPSKAEQIIQGAGCWHPTFPARLADIQMLAAQAVNIIAGKIDSNSNKGIAAIVKRESVAQGQFQPGSLVELLWVKEYC